MKTKWNDFKYGSLALGLAASSALCWPALGQSSSGDVFDEILVTARKRTENLQSVPISVTAFTKRDLTGAGINDIVDIADFAPGFSFEKTFGRQLDRPVIRGMSSTLSGTRIEQSASFFIDGVLVSGAISATDLLNVERVEVIRGPQNALYGRATFAGAVNYITRQPSMEHEGTVSASIAEHGQYEASAYVSGPIAADKLAVSLGARYYTYGGEYLNTVTGENVGGEESVSVSGALKLVGSEKFDATARISFARDDDEHPAIALQDSTYNNCFLNTRDQYYCGKVHVFDSVSLNTDDVRGGGLERDILRSSLTTNAYFGDYRLTSLTAFNDETVNSGLDLDYTGRRTVERIPSQRGAFQTFDSVAFKDFSQELRLYSPDDRRLRLMGGVYFLYRRQGGENILPTPGLKPVDKTWNYAAFGQALFDVTDRLTAGFEMRYAEDDLELDLLNGTVLKETYKSFTPRFTLDYQAGDGLLLYVNVARGTKPGGFNSATNLPVELRPFDEERAWSYEAGAKTSWLDDRLLANVSVFHVDWQGQQLSSLYQPPTGRSILYTLNAGVTDVDGLEFEMIARPLRQVEMRASYALANSIFKVFDVPEQAALTGNPSVAGNRSPRAPKHMATFSTTLRDRLSEGLDWFVRGDLLYESTRFAQAHNLAETGDKTLVNLRFGVESENVTVTAWVRNLFDDRTAVSITRYRDFAGYDSFTAPRAFAIALPRGRQAGLTASYRF